MSAGGPHYDVAAVAAALAALGVRRGDTLFSHSNIGFLGVPAGERSAANACRTVLAGIHAVIGAEGTLVVPTFTYSFPDGKEFDVRSAPSTCGLFTEFVRTHAGARRSLEPCVSVAALGARAAELTADAPENAYGPGCFWERLLAAGGVICNFNFDAGSTFLHYAERLQRVPYRFDKTFSGTVVDEGGARRARRSTIWVRQLGDDDLVAAFEPFTTLARATGDFREAPLGRGRVGVITARASCDLLARTLPTRPWLLTRAESTGRTPVLSQAGTAPA